MDNPLSWLTVTAAVAYLIGCLLRQAVYEIEERHAASERAWKEEGLCARLKEAILNTST